MYVLIQLKCILIKTCYLNMFVFRPNQTSENKQWSCQRKNKMCHKQSENRICELPCLTVSDLYTFSLQFLRHGFGWPFSRLNRKYSFKKWWWWYSWIPLKHAKHAWRMTVQKLIEIKLIVRPSTTCISACVGISLDLLVTYSIHLLLFFNDFSCKVLF